ncbi:MAG: MarR family winged helix-turn-helix transcriptional regulator [Chloroflexi bacterium]|nr:MarR family winged helix-turn-helix transcriptional regulator [Chloroflexota bacterium]
MLNSTTKLDIERVRRMGEACPLGRLRMATRVATQIYDGVLKPTGLKSTQFNLLTMIASLAPTTISQLADQIAMDRTTLTRNLKPLERAKLVSVTPGDDRRTRTVTLSPQGEALLSGALELWERAQSSIVTELGERWRRDLLSGLSSLVALGGERDQ